MTLPPRVKAALAAGEWVIITDPGSVPALEALGKTACASPNGDSGLFKGAKVAIIAGSSTEARQRALDDACQFDPIAEKLQVYELADGYSSIEEQLAAGVGLDQMRPFEGTSDALASPLQHSHETHFDPETGEVVSLRIECAMCDTYIREWTTSKLQLVQAERELRAKRSRIARLEAELAPDDESPLAQIMEALFRYWIVRTGRNAKKRQPVLGKKRREQLAARLREGASPADICRGFDGVATAPYRGDDGTVYNDLIHVCRDEAQLEAKIAMADRVNAPSFYPQWVRQFGEVVEAYEATKKSKRKAKGRDAAKGKRPKAAVPVG